METKNRFNHDDIGWNYRLSNIQAALGLSQLKRIKKIVKRKEQIGKKYYSILNKNPKSYKFLNQVVLLLKIFIGLLEL